MQSGNQTNLPPHTNGVQASPGSSALQLLSFWKDSNQQFCGMNFPPELMKEIMLDKFLIDVFQPALQHAADGQYDELKALLDQYPYLVLCTGTVTTPGGLTVKNTTLLECAIGAGDWAMNENSPGMAEMIMGYFDRLPNGEKALADQLERCKTLLVELESQQAYDLKELMQTLKDANEQEVTDMLNKKMDSTSVLCAALKQFRIDVTPGIITEPHMHYNHQTLIHAFELLDTEWNNMTDNQQYLFWRQVIGFLQRSLPAVDRFIFAQACLYDVAEKKKPLVRATECKYDTSFHFPSCCSSDSSLAGLGFDIGIYGHGRGSRWALRPAVFKNLCQTKTSVLASLCCTLPSRKHHSA